MSETAADNRKQQLLDSIRSARDHMRHNRDLYTRLRNIIRTSKVVAALLTSASAIVTSVTKEPAAALLTAVAGTFTAVIEVTSREFEADNMRAHYYTFFVEFKQLCERIEIESSLNDEQIKKYQMQFHKLEAKEVQERPSLRIKTQQGGAA